MKGTWPNGGKWRAGRRTGQIPLRKMSFRWKILWISRSDWIVTTKSQKRSSAVFCCVLEMNTHTVMKAALNTSTVLLKYTHCTACCYKTHPELLLTFDQADAIATSCFQSYIILQHVFGVCTRAEALNLNASSRRRVTTVGGPATWWLQLLILWLCRDTDWSYLTLFASLPPCTDLQQLPSSETLDWTVSFYFELTSVPLCTCVGGMLEISGHEGK